MSSNILVRKKDLLMILDAIGNQWTKNRWKNKDYILALMAMKTGIKLQNDEAVTKIFSDMIRAINSLQELGAFDEMANDESYVGRIGFFRDKLIEKINSGEFFKGLNEDE